MIVSKSISIVAVALFLGLPAFSQNPSVAAPNMLAATPAAQSPQVPSEDFLSPAVRMITDFKDSDVRFDVKELVDILRDRKHEGWVLAAYPDPRTSQPLIGAGFSLDLPEREHPQNDPLNPHQFLEPASADLWRAAGFDPNRLDDILKVFYERRRHWTKRTWRRQLYSLPAQISDDEAIQLVRVGAIQAIYNAQAYCRNFDQLTGPQQMAMAQLVYQMGVNLQHFTEFLALINGEFLPMQSEAASVSDPQVPVMNSVAFTPDKESASITGNQPPEYWQGVQKSLMASQWAHKYRTRAITVIAMLDPAYGDDPSAAEQRVSAVLRPAVVHRRHTKATAATRQVSAKTHNRHTKKSRARARNGERA
jgi:hypothetical protein